MRDSHQICSILARRMKTNLSALQLFSEWTRIFGLLVNMGDMKSILEQEHLRGSKVKSVIES